jgi:signal transduction histidine kinase
MPAPLHALSTKLALALAAVFTALGVFFVFLMSEVSEHYQQEVAQKLNRDLAQHILAERLLLEEGNIDHAGLEHIFHMLMVINPRVELYLLDPEGRILAYSAPPGKVMRQRIDLAPLQRFLAEPGSGPILGDDPRAADQRKVFSAAPVEHDGRLQGYLYVILGGEAYDSVAGRLQGSYVFQLYVAVVAAGLLFALLAAMLLFTLLTRRLRRLAGAMEQFRHTGQAPMLAPARPATHGDEVDRLATTFTEMVHTITAQVERLRQTDSLRRDLVANVSHDLRTPLASLHGYLETLRLKDAELDGEDKRRYLEIAIRHSERLSALVAELFELAKLDADEVKPQCEPFSLPELVQDVVQKFRLRAEQQEVALEYRFSREPLPFVLADIGLIERVLDNLLVNALRHTPAGGAVIVSLSPGDRQVRVQVSDTGRGIAAHELPYVFDRFYKGADRARQTGSGAGLGLAIVRRILELHGSVIRATSQLRNGTTFSFELPAGSAA